MSSNIAATARMVDKYRSPISDFVAGRAPAKDFESKYLQLFKSDTDQIPGHEFDVLEALFFAIDHYVGDPALRAKVGGLNEDELRERAARAFQQLWPKWPSGSETLMKNALEGLPAESSAAIEDELSSADPNLLAQLRSTPEPTNEQRAAVDELLARAVIRSMGDDWEPNERGLAAERAVKAFLEKWPLNG